MTIRLQLHGIHAIPQEIILEMECHFRKSGGAGWALPWLPLYPYGKCHFGTQKFQYGSDDPNMEQTSTCRGQIRAPERLAAPMAAFLVL